LKNGYQYFYGIHGGAADYISHKGEGRRQDLYEDEKEVLQEGYLTEMFTQKAIAFLQQQHNKPFFLTLNYNAPHWPWQGPTDKAYADTTDFRAGGSPAVYAAMLKSLDDGVGAVMAALDRAGLSKQTIVIFTNDNGGEKFSDHGGLAQQKGTLWEGGIKVPAFVRWPGKIRPGTVTKQAAITMDWTATILAAASAKAGRSAPLDGLDLMPILREKQPPIDRTFYWRCTQRNQQKAMREGRWKYLQDKAGEYLFDVEADPGEKNNLKQSNPGIFKRLQLKYADWEKIVLTPIPL
jgi:arylsulfatase A-like enzyme